jgi:hypothetical protein
MEKIFQILAVFALVMFLITWFIRGSERRLGEYSFRSRQKGQLLPDHSGRLIYSWLIPPDGVLPMGPGGMVPDNTGPEGSDPDNQLLFRRNENNACVMDVFDERTGFTLASLAMEHSVDAIVFDGETRLIYCCSVQSALYVIRQLARQEYKMLQWVTIPAGSSLLALDRNDKTVYVQNNEYHYVYPPA